MGDDPPFLPVGTDVSAKYKGAFCEAKIKKVVRNIKCKVTLKAGGIITVNDDVIKGNLRVGNTVEVKQDPKKDAMEAVITKIQDCSQYTVVFDDGDITTLRRSALCLKSGRHFNESETLDQLPLTHPEHFSTPVIAGRRGRRGRQQSDDSDPDSSTRRLKPDSAEREPHVGRVVLVEAAGGTERRRPHQPAFPALVVPPTSQIKVKEDYLVRSFKDGRYYTVPKKEAREFRKGSAPIEWSGVEAALQYLNNGVLPPHWDRDGAEQAGGNGSDSSDDEPREEKDHFVAQLYKFMDDRGTPLNRNPTIANKDIDLYRLFRVVEKLGGYNRVTNQNQWKSIADKMGFHPVTTSITNLCKQAYKKFLHSFEDFYRKLGVTLVAHPRGGRTPPAGRSLIRDRDKLPAATSPATTQRAKDKESDKSETEKSDKSDKSDKTEKSDKSEKSEKSDKSDKSEVKIEKSDVKGDKSDSKSDKSDSKSEKVDIKTDKSDNKSDKSDAKSDKSDIKSDKSDSKSDKSDKSEKDDKSDKSSKERARTSDGEDSADNQPLISTTPKPEKEREKDKEKPSTSAKPKEEEEKPKTVPQVVRSRSVTSVKTELHERRTPKRKTLSSKVESVGTSSARASRRPHVSTDSDSSGRASRCGITKKLQSRRSQSANSASSGNTVASNSSKRPRKRKIIEPSSSSSEPIRGANTSVKAQVGDKLKVYYGPNQSESKVTYEAKVIEISPYGQLRVHYTGWNTRYDEWIKPQRIALNVTAHDRTKGIGSSRRVRAKRIEESSARSDSDSDSTDEEVKRPPKKSDDKSAKTPKAKDAKSSDSSGSSKPKPRKRPLRTVSTPSNATPPKKARPPSANSNHQGRDYDLNEIRSELKGLHTVKQEPEDTKTESPDKEATPSTSQVKTEEAATVKVEKQAEDVYEFKEPEPFELELHDEKKKRTHRIFDDISPTKYALTLSKSLSEEISDSDPLRPRERQSSLRSPSLSPFRDFANARDTSGQQSPEDDSKDGLYSLDDDSLPGDGSSGLKFEGFTPAKNQETYSKKSKVSKLRQLIDDSPDSPADDEQSSDDEPEEDEEKEDERDVSPVPEIVTPKTPKSPEAEPLEQDLEDEIKASKIDKGPKMIIISKSEKQSDADDKEDEDEKMEEPILISIPEPKTPPPQKKLSPTPLPSTSSKEVIITPVITIHNPILEPTEDIPLPEPMEIDLNSIPLPPEPKEKPSVVVLEEKTKNKDKKDAATPTKNLEPPSSPIDTEEDKSEPDSPVRLDVLPEPPPGFLLQSEGPKIAEKLLKAINSAKRLSMSPPPVEEKPPSPKKEKDAIIPKVEEKSPPASESKTTKVEPTKPVKTEPSKIDFETLFGEPSNIIDKVEPVESKKKEDILSPRLQSPLSILERRPSVADLPLAAGKSNKVLSDTIQKLSSQINQSVASIPLPPFQGEERSESSDSDDEDRRLIIDKVPVEEWSGNASGESPARARGPAGHSGHAGALAGLQALGHGPHAGKSPGEWSAGESLLMLEDACKNARKHSASVVVAGCGRVNPGQAEEESTMSLLLCAETIPGSPQPHNSDERGESSQACQEVAGGGRGRRVSRDSVGAGAGAGGGGGGWGRRHALIDNTPPTTPDSSQDMSPKRERRISERDSPSDRKDDDEDNRQNDGSSYDMDKPLRGRSRKVSESCSGVTRGRRRRRDTDEATHNYNFYVQLDPSWDCPTRINVLSSRLAELRKAYHSVKAELAAIDRRRKKLRRKERDAVKAAKAACS